jgi:hypothetical protein
MAIGVKEITQPTIGLDARRPPDRKSPAERLQRSV